MVINTVAKVKFHLVLILIQSLCYKVRQLVRTDLVHTVLIRKFQPKTSSQTVFLIVMFFVVVFGCFCVLWCDKVRNVAPQNTKTPVLGIFTCSFDPGGLFNPPH